MHRSSILIAYSDFSIFSNFCCSVVVTDENKLGLIIKDKSVEDTKENRIENPSFMIFNNIVKTYCNESIRYFCRNMFIDILTQTDTWNHNVFNMEIAKLKTLIPKSISSADKRKFIICVCENMFRKYDNLSDDELLKFFYNCLIQLSNSCPVYLFEV